MAHSLQLRFVISHSCSSNSSGGTRASNTAVTMETFLSHVYQGNTSSLEEDLLKRPELVDAQDDLVSTVRAIPAAATSSVRHRPRNVFT